MLGIMTGIGYLMCVPKKFKFFYCSPLPDTRQGYLLFDVDILLSLGSLDELDEMRKILGEQGYTTITRMSGPWSDYIGKEKRIYSMKTFVDARRKSKLPQLYGKIGFGLALTLKEGTLVENFFGDLRKRGYRTLWCHGDQDLVLR